MANEPFSVTTGDLQDLQDQLEIYAHRAVPFAVRNGLKGAGFAMRTEWQGQMKRKLTLRNTFTVRSVRVDTSEAKGLNVRTMSVTTGSVAPFADRMEFGGVITKRGREGKPIPTNRARVGTSPKKVVSRPNKLSQITLRDRNRSGTRKQRNAKAIRDARAKGTKYVFLDLERRKGIFKISGSKRAIKVDMIWDMSRPSVTVPPTPTMKPALISLGPALPAIYANALLEQLTRNKVLGF